ncbi:hypothetical protein HMPREF1051_2620 [Neisseria sicca VK64]|uniref:Uncharacterized protein n=1 Tax=Neisseria sicca VK64 TaxID=1095748 RepID=I2NU50_NEISI|nr:hypothetical protein HMPREF1051_2620 [Neisseria sicca VK64]
MKVGVSGVAVIVFLLCVFMGFGFSDGLLKVEGRLKTVFYF